MIIDRENLQYDKKYVDGGFRGYVIAPKITIEENQRRMKVIEDTINYLGRNKGWPKYQLNF